MSRTRITTNVHLHEDAPPVSLKFTLIPAREDCLAFHAVQLGDLTIYADWDHLKSIADQLIGYVREERRKAVLAALTPTSTTGEAGMAAGDRLGEAVGKYRPSVTAEARPYDLQRDTENADALEVFREKQEAHS